MQGIVSILRIVICDLSALLNYAILKDCKHSDLYKNSGQIIKLKKTTLSLIPTEKRLDHLQFQVATK